MYKSAWDSKTERGGCWGCFWAILAAVSAGGTGGDGGAGGGGLVPVANRKSVGQR